ncbi:MAG: pyrimidine/purine nucleoside phosphorylase [Mucilaginibacter sp.]
MSNSSNPVSHNTYFEGRVQSLGLETEKGRATLGVMKKGAYQFDTSTKETMIFIEGVVSTNLPGGEWQKHQKQDALNIPAGIVFDINCETDVAYICYYG